MSNIVSLKPEILVWACGACDCSTLEVFSNGTTRCPNCGDVADREWAMLLPDPEYPPKKKVTPKVITLAASPASALRNMMNNVNVDELAALIAIEENGRVRTWGGVNDPERKRWLRWRLKDAYDLMTRPFVKEGEDSAQD